MAIPSQIRSLTIEDQHIHCMIVAPPGFGKTVFAGTAEDALFLTTDPEGTVSALAMGSDAREWKINSWTELNDAFRYLRDGGIEELGIKWVLIDNISEAQNLGMKENMDNARKFNPRLDEFIPSQADYQRTQNMVRDMVKRFHDLPVNVLWTCWRTREEDAQTGDFYYSAAIHGQKGALAETIMGYMNVIGFGEVATKDGEQVRRLYFDQIGPQRGKDRFGVLGRVRDNFTVPKMEALVGGAMKKYAAPTKPAAQRTAARRPTTKTPRRAAS